MDKNHKLFLFLTLGGAGLVTATCVFCVGAAALLPSPDASASASSGAPGDSTGGADDVGSSSFDTFAAQLHLGDCHVEGPGSELLSDICVGAEEDDDTGIALKVMPAGDGHRVAFLYAFRDLRDFGDADRQELLREFARQAEEGWGLSHDDVLIAIRGRMLFGASAIRTGGGEWVFQAGSAIDMAPLRSFFEVPPVEHFEEEVHFGPEAPDLELTTELEGDLQLGNLTDCDGAADFEPNHVIVLDALTRGLTFSASTDLRDQGLYLTVLRPDGVRRCGYEGSVSGDFPAGTYRIWIGRQHADRTGDATLRVTRR